MLIKRSKYAMSSLHYALKPQRTCIKKYAHYKSYRPVIEKDFNNSCGYCGDPDIFYGHYHIDHFKPHSISKFSHLKEEYANLVYACPFCNLSKSDKWFDTDSFIDPCQTDYDSHLFRNEHGAIEPISNNGQRMYKELRLYLKRHELIWIITQLSEQKQAILALLKKSPSASSKKVQLLETYVEIQECIDRYVRPYIAG